VSKVCWSVPFARNLQFVGRHTQLDQLESALFAKDHPPKMAITGLGGMGKTQIALELAYRIREKHPDCSVLWVPATNAEGLQQAFTEIGQQLGVPGIEGNQANNKKLVQRYLDEQSTGQWLLIVDNIDDMEIWTSELRDYLPTSQIGRVVCTTRNRKVALKITPSNLVEVPKMDDKTAMELLCKLLPNQKLSSEVHEDAQNLFEQLMFIPLAIVQAAAYIKKNGTTLSKYLSLLDNQEQEVIELLSEGFEDDSRYRDDENMTNPVATTWLISFEQIRQLDPLAADYLSFISCVAPKNIPESLLPPLASSPVKRENAIGTLDAYSFITRGAADLAADRAVEDTLHVHRLVQLATRNWLKSKDQWHDWVEKALARLIEIVPFGGHKERKVWTAYLPHAIHVVEPAELRNAEGTISLLNRIGYCEWELGRYEAAVWAWKQLLRRRVKILGKEHPHTLASMNNLAQALSSQGKYTEAEQMHQETLALQEKVLGKEHPHTLTSMHNVALVLSSQGKYTEAEEMHQETLALTEKVLGKEHLDTLASMHNLAYTLCNQGKYAEAEQMHRETLALYEKVLGKEHPHTLASTNDLATVLSSQGKCAEAEQMHRETLALYEKVLGKEHPHTLASMNNLAYTLCNQGKYAEAMVLMQKCVQLRQKVLGPQHPDTLASLGTLSEWQEDV
jgi:tetratricopeptide (TPR) repeat protein